MLDARVQLLEGKRILVVLTATGKARSQDDFGIVQMFIQRALGVSKIGIAKSAQEARQMLVNVSNKSEPEWDWVYTQKPNADTETILFDENQNKFPGLHKRKRSASTSEDERAPRRLKMITNEFIVQSLILGQLVEND
jgi:hypothetical protein